MTHHPKKGHRSGDKYTGTHTMVIPAAAILADIANKQPEVTKISLGFIKAGLPSAGGVRRAKITERQGNLLIAVRDNTSQQEIAVYTPEMQKTKLALFRDGQKAGIEISFAKVRK